MEISFDFITDDEFRIILKRDYEELQGCFSNKLYKSVIVLSGSIVEAVLADHFINNPTEGLNKKKILNLSLHQLISHAKKENLIDNQIENLSDVIKDYRNLIHPGREKRKQDNIDADKANIAKSVVNIILKQLRKDYLKNNKYTASDLFQKIRNEQISIRVFESLLGKTYKKDKNILFKSIITGNPTSANLNNGIKNEFMYLEILKSQIDESIIVAALNEMIDAITKGYDWEVLKYFKYLNKDIELLSKDDKDLLLSYLLDVFVRYSTNINTMKSYLKYDFFTSLGSHLTDNILEKQYCNLIENIVLNYEKDPTTYTLIYNQLIQGVNDKLKAVIEKEINKNIDSTLKEGFFKEYQQKNLIV